MSVWHELLTPLVRAAVTRMVRPPSGLAMIDRLSAQLGWSLHERRGDAAVLQFSDPIAGSRTLYVRPVENGEAVFMTASLVVFGSVPQVVTEYLLARNAQLVAGAWSASVVERGTMLFLVHRTALGSLTAVAFHDLCEALVREAQCLDSQFRAAGISA